MIKAKVLYSPTEYTTLMKMISSFGKYLFSKMRLLSLIEPLASLSSVSAVELPVSNFYCKLLFLNSELQWKMRPVFDFSGSDVRTPIERDIYFHVI